MEEKQVTIKELIEKGIDPDRYYQLSTTQTRNRLSIMLAAIGAGLILVIFSIAIFKTSDPTAIQNITDKALLVVSSYVGATLPPIVTSLFDSKTNKETV